LPACPPCRSAEPNGTGQFPVSIKEICAPFWHQPDERVEISEAAH